MVTGPVITRPFSAATAAVKVVKSPPVPVLKLPMIVGAPVSLPTAKKPSEVTAELGPIVGGATVPPMLPYAPVCVVDCPMAFAETVPASVRRTVALVKFAAPAVICAFQ